MKRFSKDCLSADRDVALLPYNPLWQDKALKLGRLPALTCGFMSPEQLADCARHMSGEYSE